MTQKPTFAGKTASNLTLFRLGFLETLYDWGGGVKNARGLCLLMSRQLLALELLFKFV